MATQKTALNIGITGQDGSNRAELLLEKGYEVHGLIRRASTFNTHRIAAGLQGQLYIGNLDAARDWGYVKEYVEAMWRMLQVDQADDFVIATGTSYTVRDFLRLAFEHVGLDWEKHVRIDDRYLRPTEVDDLMGDPSKAAARLGWVPRVPTPELLRLMCDADLLQRTAGLSATRL